MDELTFSIIIPVWNCAFYIRSCLDSVLNQSYQNIEVLIVDDGSEEDIETLVKTFQDDRIFYYRLPHSNANVARNYGIRKARDKYIAMLDADDIWKSDHLADCIHVLKQTGADGLYGDLLVRYESGREIEITAEPVRGAVPKRTMFCLLELVPFQTPSPEF